MSATIETLLLQHRVEQFYFTEARMIDERKFSAWLDLFTKDTRYLLPIHRNTASHEFTDSLGDAGLAHFDDDKDVLRKRVFRMSSGRAWAEDPPSIQRHLITNVQVGPPVNGQIEAHSCFQTHRYRMDREVEVFTGARVDALRIAGDSFQIASRTVYLDHTTVLANNINLFF